MASVLSRLDAAMATPVDDLDWAGVRAELQLISSVESVTAARRVALHRRLGTLASSSHLLIGLDPAHELRRHGGLRRRDVRSIERQTTAVDAAPELDRMWSAGATTTAHVEVVGRALETAGTALEGVLERVDDIVEQAAVLRIDDFDRYVRQVVRDSQPDEGIDRFERQRRLTQLRVWNDTDGMVNLAGCFDPERGAALVSSLQRRVEAMFHSGDTATPIEVMAGVEPNDHRRALALLSMCSGGHTAADSHGACGDPRPARAEVVVHIDLQTLQQGLHAAGVCHTQHGADIPPATARRLACDAEIVPLVLGRPSAPLDVGRAHRLATVHQRRALEAVHRTCAMPDCTVAFSHCTIHHIVPWEKGGATDLFNLVPLCSRHHHAVHEGGWIIRLDPATRRVDAAPPGARFAAVDDDRGADPHRFAPALGSDDSVAGVGAMRSDCVIGSDGDDTWGEERVGVARARAGAGAGAGSAEGGDPP